MILNICENPDILKVVRIVKIVINILKISIPIIMIISLMINYLKNINEDGEIKKANKKTVTTIIAAICIFLIPTFLNIIFSIVGGNGYKDCLKNSNTETIEQLYETKMDELVSNCENTLTRIDYNIAKNYLKNIDDSQLKEEYLEKLNDIDSRISELEK